MKAVIVEDETPSLNYLQMLLKKHHPEVKVIGTAGSNEEAMKMFEELGEKPDVAFLDINLPDGLIFKTLDQLRPLNFEVIFITAYQEYAIRACKFASIDYILKPFDIDHINEALSRMPDSEKIKERLEVMYNAYNCPNAFEKLSIAAVDGIYFINLRDIVRLEGEGNYTDIYLRSGERITVSKTIRTYEDLLESLNFFRVHKRHIINFNHIRKYMRGEGGYLIMDDNTKIEVARRKRGLFLEKLRMTQDVL
jgi:two-component system LytT family response regulator